MANDKPQARVHDRMPRQTAKKTAPDQSDSAFSHPALGNNQSFVPIHHPD
jgi:hypothetical protein